MEDKAPTGPRAQAPNQGLYYTGDNVDNTLPRIPEKPKPKLNPYDTPAGGNRYNSGGARNTSKDDIEKVAKMMKQDPIPAAGAKQYPNRLGSRANQVYGKPQENNNKVQEGKNFELTPWFLRPFANPNTDRAVGRQAKIVKIGLKSTDGRRTDIQIIFLLYQMMIGALGGIVAGIESGYLAPPPEQTAPTKSVVQSGVVTTKLAGRSCKRALAAGLLFNFVEKNVEQSRGKSDWKNFAYAGVVCGGLYGLRGGLRGGLTGSAMFGAFAGLSGFYEQLKRKSKMK